MFRQLKIALTLCAAPFLAGCAKQANEEFSKASPSSTAGAVVIEPASQKRLGIVTHSVQSREVAPLSVQVGWLELPPAAQVIVRAPLTGFVVPSASNSWPSLGTEVRIDTPLAQVNVFLSPQEVTQLVIAKEDNDVQMQQALTTMQLTQSQLDNVEQARDAITAVRLNELKQALAHSQAAFKEAKDKLPFLVQEPYDEGLLVKPVPIETPMAGRIVKMDGLKGQFVVAGDPLWTIQDWSRLWLRVPVLADRLSSFDHQQPATMPLEDGELVSLQPVSLPVEVKPLTRTVDLIYEVSNPDWSLRAGQSLSVRVPLRHSNNKAGNTNESLVIPSSAVLYNEFGQATCFVAMDENQFKRRRLELGVAVGDDVVVERGLSAADFIVSSGAQRLAAEESKADIVVDDED